MVLTVAFVAVASLVTVHWKHVGEASAGVQRDLQAVMTELRAQDALQWRAIATQLAPGEVSGPLGRSRSAVSRLVDRTEVNEVGCPLPGLLARYAAAVDTELALLGDGQIAQAIRVAEEQVDPAFQDAVTAARMHAAASAAMATTNQARSDAGLLCTVLSALLLVAVVQGRRRRIGVRLAAEFRSEARYRALVDQSSDVVVVVDGAGAIRYGSPSAERALQRAESPGAHSGVAPTSEDQHPGVERGLLACTHPDDRPRLRSALAAGGTAEPVELRWRGEDMWRVYDVSVRDLTDVPAVAGLVVTGHDVTDRYLLEQEMAHRAQHDALTGLPNRALLSDRFGQALRRARRSGDDVGLLLIDLDRFKEINDTMGHHVGDQLLVQVGRRMQSALRAEDTVARLGGDEFAVLLPSGGTVDHCLGVAAKLRGALEEPFDVFGVNLDVEASVGVVVSGEHGGDATLLLQRADVAMYEAKRRGAGVLAYDPATDVHSPERLTLLGDLRRALDERTLFLEYQPKVDLGTGEVCGAEALLRWVHPQRGRVAPAEFIPLAENSGLIGPITGYVLDLALDQAAAWLRQGAPLQVAVNLSARNLADEQLDGLVAQLLARHDVPAALLKLEVTESALMVDPARSRALLHRLVALGVDIAIDDFGAGYTSLGQLRDLPVTELKVDRSFIATMCAEPSNGLIVASLIELCHSLGMTAVAEGVETHQVLAELAALTCDVVQGYHVSRPLTAAAFDAWRAAWPGLPTDIPPVRGRGVAASS